MPRHQRGDRAAVDAAGQEHAERHVAHQPQPDRLLEQRAEPLDDVVGAARAVDVRLRRRRDVPVPPDAATCAVLEHEQVAGQQLVDAAEQRLRRRTCTACSAPRAATASLARGLDQAAREDRLDLRREQQPCRRPAPSTAA